ncbi:MAG TPA: vitamin K epoxide reductase family protein [Terriglobales bacterium]|jgi:uncharacterized membrane protein
MPSSRLYNAVSIVGVAGVTVSSVSLYHHYGSSQSSFCDFGGSFNCDMVNRSIYSTVLGVPVALIGILGYALIFGLASFQRGKPETAKMLLAACAVGLGFALYLTYVEAFVLTVWCILCLSSLGLILAGTVLSGALTLQSRQ